MCVTAKKFFTSKVKKFSLRSEKNRVTANFFHLRVKKKVKKIVKNFVCDRGLTCIYIYTLVHACAPEHTRACSHAHEVGEPVDEAAAHECTLLQ